MRLLILFFLAVTMLSCSAAPDQKKMPLDKSLTEKSLIGQWNIVNKMLAPELERVTKISGARSLGGYVIFKADMSYEFLIKIATNGDGFDARTAGTYKYENNVLSMTDSKTGKIKQSSLKFEDDLLIISPLDEDVDPNFLLYLKHSE